MKKKFLVFFLICIGSFYATGRAVDYKHAYCVILAGGSGTRLWPISREKMPKQLLHVGCDLTLLEQAIERAGTVVPKDNIWISTTQKYKAAIEQHVGDKIGNIVVEPGLRNTGPAILLSCMELYRHDPDAAVIFLPADHFIPSKKCFAPYLEKAFAYVFENNRIVLLGLKPRYPATGYGYIEHKKVMRSDEMVPYVVKNFHEKPVFEVAQRYCDQGNMLWNAGMFCAKAKVFVDEFHHVAPDIYEDVKAYLDGKSAYGDVRAESIDYAIMEKSSLTSVFPVDFEWCDVGGIEEFLVLQKAHGLASAKVLQVNSHNNLVHVDGKLVALVGVDDLCIVETDDTILIARRDQAQKVRQIVQQLKQAGSYEYL